MGYIYKITNNINKKVYIGKTEGDVALRWHQHIYNMNNGVFYHLYNAMRKYGIQNFSFDVLESDVLSQNINDREQFYISQYDSLNNGYNMTIGGDGVTKYSHEDIKNKFLELNNISQTALFFNCSENTVRRTLKEYGIYNNFNNALFAKKVVQYDLKKDEVLNIYNSLGEAAKAVNGTPQGISSACRKEVKQAYGYRWKFESDTSILPEVKVKNKQIAQINKDTNEIIQIFESIKIAANQTNCDYSGIRKVCIGERKTCGGFKWQYYEKD